MKRCFKCLRDLPLEEFYRHRMMADGRLSKCKDCARKDVQEQRLKKIERIREYDRARAAKPHRIALRSRITREWREQHPDRAKAQEKAGNAHRDGVLVAPSACEGCHRVEVRIEKHHPDYSRPLLVMWLCKPCHAIADKIRRILETA